jgi:predicted amidohydrolase
MKLTIGLCQLNSGDDTTANRTAAIRAIGEAASAGARLVMLPEHADYIGTLEGKRAAAQPLDESNYLQELAGCAKAHAIYLHIGSFLERRHERIYNTAVVFAPDGSRLAVYRKIHLFDVEVPGGASFRESDTISAGSEVVVADIDGLVCGLATCYDLRFPELFRQLVMKGARLLLVPAAFTMQTGRDHWELLLRARAVENLCWLAAAGQWGTAPPNHSSFGRSMVIDPWGTITAQASDGVGVVIATVDTEPLNAIRSSFPCLNHIRHDLFFA